MKLFFSSLPPEQVPSVRATVMHLSGHDLSFGLDVIIDGFKCRLARKAAAAAFCPDGSESDKSQSDR